MSYPYCINHLVKKSIICLLLMLPSLGNAQKLKINKADLIAATFSIVAGIGQGTSNAYQADPYVFEKLDWTNKYWRHNSWENNYVGDTYFQGATLKKPEFLNGFRDVGHGSEDALVLGLTLSTSITGLSEGIKVSNKKSKWWHAGVKLVGQQLIRSATANLIYNKLRYNKWF